MFLELKFYMNSVITFYSFLLDGLTFFQSQLHLVAEKSRNNDRIAKLEEQMKNLSMSQSR